MLDSGRKQTRLSKIKIPKAISISQDKESVRVVSKWVPVQGSVALANLDLYIKTAQSQPFYSPGTLMKI